MGGRRHVAVRRKSYARAREGGSCPTGRRGAAGGEDVEEPRSLGLE